MLKRTGETLKNFLDPHGGILATLRGDKLLDPNREIIFSLRGYKNVGSSWRNTYRP